MRTGEVLELLYVGSRTTKDQEWAYVRRPGKPEEAGWLSLLVVQVPYASLGIYQMQEDRYSAALRSDLEAARSDQEATTSELASVRACLAQLLGKSGLATLQWWHCHLVEVALPLTQVQFSLLQM